MGGYPASPLFRSRLCEISASFRQSAPTSTPGRNRSDRRRRGSRREPITQIGFLRVFGVARYLAEVDAFGNQQAEGAVSGDRGSGRFRSYVVINLSSPRVPP